MSILQTTELKKYYGAEPNITRALDGVTLSIEKGEFVAMARREQEKLLGQHGLQNS